MKNGEQPINPVHEDCKVYLGNGLTKREYFAGLAMQGLLANSYFSEEDEEEIAALSIAQADELLKQLEDGKYR